jgi:TRAP-type C4-dicarboxylate transport system permease large subunit
MARFFKDRLLIAIGVGIGWSILEAFLDPTLALVLIGLAVLAFFVYVASKNDWKDGLIPVSHQQALHHREEKLHETARFGSTLTKLQQSE